MYPSNDSSLQQTSPDRLHTGGFVKISIKGRAGCSLRAGQRAAAIASLIRSAQLNAHDPYAYLKDVVTRLPTVEPMTLLSC